MSGRAKRSIKYGEKRMLRRFGHVERMDDERMNESLGFGHKDPAMGAGAHSPPVIPDLHQVVWCSMAQILL